MNFDEVVILILAWLFLRTIEKPIQIKSSSTNRRIYSTISGVNHSGFFCVMILSVYTCWNSDGNMQAIESMATITIPLKAKRRLPFRK
jgi:hypothetical protein